MRKDIQYSSLNLCFKTNRKFPLNLEINSNDFLEIFLEI